MLQILWQAVRENLAENLAGCARENLAENLARTTYQLRGRLSIPYIGHDRHGFGLRLLRGEVRAHKQLFGYTTGSPQLCVRRTHRAGAEGTVRHRHAIGAEQNRAGRALSC